MTDIFYHGTDEVSKIEQILQDGGLKAPAYQNEDLEWSEWPWQYEDQDPDDGYTYIPRKQAVFVTPNFNRARSHTSEDGAVFRLNMPDDAHYDSTVYRGIPDSQIDSLYLLSEDHLSGFNAEDYSFDIRLFD